MESRAVRRAVITPTFSGHFENVIEMLKSFVWFVKKPTSVVFVFTIDKEEIDFFNKLVQPLVGRVNFEVYSTEAVFEFCGINDSPSEILRKYGKFSFQTLKKFCTMKFVPYEQFLILDSETSFCDDFSFDEMFEKYFADPFISGSDMKNRKGNVSWFTQGAAGNIEYLIDEKNLPWFLENFVWFYSKEILRELEWEHGSFFEMVKRAFERQGAQSIDVFEIQLYHGYLYKNRERLGYRYIDVDAELKKALPPVLYSRYMQELHDIFDGNCGVLERAFTLVNPDNLLEIGRLIRNLGFDVVRCDEPRGNYSGQVKLFNLVKPKILAASQDHWLGWRRDKKLKKHFDEKRYAQVWELKNKWRDFHGKYLWWLVPPVLIAYWWLRGLSVTKSLASRDEL